MKTPDALKSLVLFACCSSRVLADARTVPWTEFMAPIQLVCTGTVIAAREEIEKRQRSQTLPDGTVVTPVQRPRLVSTLEVDKSLLGHCPRLLELAWEKPLGFPAFNLELNHVLSDWVVFLDNAPSHKSAEVHHSTVSPRHAWRLELLTDEKGEMLRVYHPQNVAVPEALRGSARVRTYFQGGSYVVHYDVHVNADVLQRRLLRLATDPPPNSSSVQGSFI